jgi:hypothetical protein
MDLVSLCNGSHINYKNAKCASACLLAALSTFPGGDGLIIHSGDGFKAIFAGEQQVKFREEN